jgi:hypothetical protein
MIDTLRDILLAWRPCEAGPDDLVFPNQKGGPLDRSDFLHRKLMVKKEGSDKPEAIERFESVLTRAGLRRIRFHDLRHTFASLSIEAGVDAKTLQGIMGHSSIIVTMDVYGHLYTSSFERASLALDNHVSGGLRVVPTLKSVEIAKGAYGIKESRPEDIYSDLLLSWWAQQDSNLRHADYESAALTN